MAARHAARDRSNAKAGASEGHARHAGHLAQNAPGEKDGRRGRLAHRGRAVAVAVAISAVVAAGAVMASPQLRGQIFSPTGGAGNDASASAAESRRDDASASASGAKAKAGAKAGASGSGAPDASAPTKAEAAPQEDATPLDTGAEIGRAHV